MLPKENRLKKKSAFKATYKTGHSVHVSGITAFCGKNKKNNAPVKIGFVVSKKIHKRAVHRNYIKRLMRESCRLLIKDNAIPDNYMSIIFVASNKLLNKNFNEINDLIKILVNKL